MKAIVTMAALALLTCGAAWAGPTKPTSNQAATLAASDADNHARMVGVWADDEACTQYASMHADGSFHSYAGGDGIWTLTGDVLVMSGTGGSYPMHIRWIDADHLELTMQDGSLGHSHRCPDNGN